MVPRTGCLCRALSLVDGSQHPGAGPWPAREGLAPCGAAPESMVPGRLGAPPGALGGRPRLSPVEPVSRGHSRGGLPQPLGSLRALPSRPPCAPGGTRGDAHTRTPAHTGGEAVSCCSLLWLSGLDFNPCSPQNRARKDMQWLFETCAIGPQWLA